MKTIEKAASKKLLHTCVMDRRFRCGRINGRKCKRFLKTHTHKGNPGVLTLAPARPDARFIPAKAGSEEIP